MSNEEKALVPIEERQVDFYGDGLTAVRTGDNTVYVPVRPLCDLLGIQWAAQRKRILRDRVLSQEIVSVSIMDTQSTPPQHREMVCLPLDYVNGFLFGIDANRIRPELQDKVVRYQRECYRVLATAFVRTSAPTPSEVTLMQIREMGLAIAQMAEQQLEMERRLTTRLDKAATIVGSHERRITILEQRLHPGQMITEEQAAEISQQVKALALLLTDQDKSKNHYQGVFTELYRRFGVTSYKLIPQQRFPAVLEFLDEWRQRIIGQK